MTWLLAQSGGGNAPNYIQIIVFALMISISIISWLVKLIAQKREEAKVIASKRRRQEEMLRTGRTEDGSPIETAQATVAQAGPASHEDAKRRLQEIAQRRRAELEQMSRGGPGVPPAPPARPTQNRPMGPAGPMFPSARPAPEPKRPRPAQKSEQRKRKPQPRPQVEPPRPAPVVAAQPTLAEKLMQPQPAGKSAYAIAPQAAPAAVNWNAPAAAMRTPTRITLDKATSPGGIESLRKALVLAEVLGPPLSLRPPGHAEESGPLMQRAG